MKCVLHSKTLSLSITLFAFLCLFSYIEVLASEPNPSWLKNVTMDVSLDMARGGRISLVDINNDNYPDLIYGADVGIIKNHVRIFMNIPNPDKSSPYKRIFKDMTQESGATKSRIPGNTDRISDITALADVDNDGDVDLISGIYYHRLQYYQNGNDPGDRCEVLLNDGTGKFTLLDNSGLYDLVVIDSLPVGLINATGMAFIDYDYDGFLDLYISTWFSDYAANLTGAGYYTFPDVLLKGHGNGTFTYTKIPAIEKVLYPMYGVNVTDWDNDGWQDVITSGYCRSGGSLFNNQKNGTFIDVAKSANYSSQLMQGDGGQNLCQWEAQPADFDCDGDMDILHVNVHGGNEVDEGRTHLSINTGYNNGYSFEWAMDRMRREAHKSTHFGDQGGSWIDIDGDGRLDIVIGQMGYADANVYGQEHIYILKQNDSCFFDDVSAAIGVKKISEGHSSEQADYDLDGDQDLFISHQIRDTTWKDTIINGKKTTVVDTVILYMRISLLQNEIGNTNNWISVKLNPPSGCNKSAIGSRIHCYSDGKCQIQEVQAALGHFGNMQPFIRNFGVGQNNRIDSIVVRWPRADLPESRVVNPPLNTIIEVDGNGAATLVQNWTENVPIIAFAENMVDFDTINANTTTTAKFHVLNIGKADLVINNVQLVNNDDNGFKIIGGFTTATIAPGGSKELTVQFNPTFRNMYKAGVLFSSNGYLANNRTMDLRGLGFLPKPMIALDKKSLTFNTVWVDSIATASFNLTNYGELPLVIDSITYTNNSDDAFFVSTNLPSSLEAKSTILIEVTFKPKNVKSYSASLSIATNAYNTPVEKVDLAALCNGPAPDIQANVELLLFAKTNINTNRDKDLLITNTGNSVLTISGCNFVDNEEKIFSLNDMIFPLHVEINETKPISVRFTPKKAGTSLAQIVVNSDAYSNKNLTVGLRGTGAIPGDVFETVDDGLLTLSVNPNPIKEDATIVFQVGGYSPRALNMKLVDLNGQILKEITNDIYDIGSYQIKINTLDLAQGAYFLLINFEGKNINVPVTILK